MTIRSSTSGQRWDESGKAKQTLLVVHLALLFRNLAYGRTKFRGRFGNCVLHEQIVIPSLPAKCYQKNKGLVSTSSRCIKNTEPVPQVVVRRRIVASSWSGFPNTQT
jgi:hypothetical protein